MRLIIILKLPFLQAIDTTSLNVALEKKNRQCSQLDAESGAEHTFVMDVFVFVGMFQARQILDGKTISMTVVEKVDAGTAE